MKFNLSFEVGYFLRAVFSCAIKTTHFWGSDRSQRVASELDVNVASAEIVDDHNFMPLIRQVQRSWPTAEPVSSQDDDLLFARR